MAEFSRRTLGDFVVARIVHAGFKNKNQFSMRRQIPRTTLDRVVIAERDEDLSSHRDTLETIAKNLGYREWFELVQAWRANDVFSGLDMTFIAVPHAVGDELAGRARETGKTEAEIVGELVLQTKQPAKTAGGKGK